MTKFYISLLTLLLGTTLQTAAINPYRRYDVRSGLSDNSVKDICQDKNGYMWFATKDGFNRFNGYRFDVFGSSLTGNLLNIDVICPHSDGIRIWLGCTHALMLFDPRDESLRKFSVKSNEGTEIENCNSLFYDQDGYLWIGSNCGLFRWDENYGILTRSELTDLNGENCKYIRSIFGYNPGEIWVGTTSGLFRNEPGNGAETFRIVLRPKPESTLMGDNEITAIMQSEEGRLLTGTQNGLLTEFDPLTGAVRQYPAHDTTGKQLSVTRIHTIYRKSANFYIIGSDSGLFYFNRLDGSWTPSGDDLANESVYKCFKDREGGIWIGTFFCGVNYLSPRQDEIKWYYDDGHPESLKGNAVSQFCEDPAGNLWIATENGGLNYFDVRKNTFVDYTAKSHNNLHALYLDGEELWIGTFSRGLDRMNIRTGRVVNYRNIPEDSTSLCNDYIYVIFKARSGLLYVGTMGGLSLLDERTGRFTQVRELGNHFIYDIAEDNDGNIWVASRVNGIYRYSPKTGTWKNYRHNSHDPESPPGDQFIRVHIDSEGRIWFCGESDGICLYKPETDGFERFGIQEGLPNSIYYGMLDDGAGNLWLSSNQGIIRYNPELRTYIRYTTEDGFQSNQFNFRSSLKARNGTFYFGGINGFNQFSPFNISVNKVKPNIAISSVCMHGSNKVSTSSEHRMIPGQSLEVPSETISLDINFECLSFVAPGQNRYAWKLEGLNDDWVYTDQHSVSFMKLPAGHYTFSVMGCNNDGYWSTTTCDLKLGIQPHPFLSPLAKALYLLLALLFIILIVKAILKRQGERKEKKLIEAKMEFFTQIVHEIKTPVSLIKSPLEHVIETGHWNTDVAANLTIMKRNVDRLLELIRQLLDFRKIGDEGFRLKCTDTDISLLVEETVSRFRTSAGEISIETRLPETPMIFHVDSEAMTKILSNLLANALKYTRSSILVTLTDRSESRGGVRERRFRLAVRDDGPGIPAASRKKVFEAFYQENPVRGQGVGIGLSLVKLLVEKHNGKVAINDGEAESGCELMIEIPDIHETVSEQTSPQQTAAKANSLPAEEDTTPSKQHCIMIVEDTSDMREFLVKNFEDSYEVLPARNGLEALEILRKHACDLIISDILMPEMDGYELLIRIRQDELLCHIPFILLSAIDSIDSKIKGLESGADAYIEKPFSLNYVRATAESLLENRERVFRHFASIPNLQYEKDTLGTSDRIWLDKLTGIISENLTNEALSVDLLVERMALSRSSLQRKLKGLTGASPNKYIQLVRLKTAAQLLRKGELRINEICYLTGFSSMSWFAKCFSKQFGMRPKEYMKQSQSEPQPADNGSAEPNPPAAS